MPLSFATGLKARITDSFKGTGFLSHHILLKMKLAALTIAEAPILWPPDVKSQLNGKNLDAGKD